MADYKFRVDILYTSSESLKSDLNRVRIIAGQYDRNALIEPDTNVISVRFPSDRVVAENFGDMVKRERADIVSNCEINSL